MAKLSIAEVKRRLPVGCIYLGEFIGGNAHRAKPGNVCTKRRVETQKSQMVSRLLTGPNSNLSPRDDNKELIYLHWVGITADERDGSIFLTLVEGEDEFLKITIVTDEGGTL